jgi:hypothetical protein
MLRSIILFLLVVECAACTCLGAAAGRRSAVFDHLYQCVYLFVNLGVASGAYV